MMVSVILPSKQLFYNNIIFYVLQQHLQILQMFSQSKNLFTTQPAAKAAVILVWLMRFPYKCSYVAVAS